MGLEINALYRFEGFELDPTNRVFALGGKPIAIPSRAFDLLLYMVSNTERLLTKEELMKAVWGDTIVEESNLTQSVFLLRKALSGILPRRTSSSSRFLDAVTGLRHKWNKSPSSRGVPMLWRSRPTAQPIRPKRRPPNLRPSRRGRIQIGGGGTAWKRLLPPPQSWR
jgi:hypothetical protein